MTEPSPNPRRYSPREPDPEEGLSASVKKIRRELMAHPQPVTAAAIEIERLRADLERARRLLGYVPKE